MILLNLIFTLILSFSHEEVFSLSREELLHRESIIQNQLLQMEEALSLKSEKDFIRALSGGSECNHACEKEILSWRKAMLEFLGAMRLRVPELLRAGHAQTIKILEALWNSTLSFMRGHVNFYKMRTQFVNKAAQFWQIIRYQSHKGMNYSAKTMGRYREPTAAFLLSVVATTYIPYTAATEVLESMVLGVFHVFCHASQIAYFTMLAGAANLVDKTMKYSSYRPLDLSFTERMFFAQRMQRFYKLMGKRHIHMKSIWFSSFNPQGFSSAQNFYDESRAQVISVEKEYALISDLYFIKMLLGELGFIENIKLQYKLQKQLRNFTENIEILDFEMHLNQKFTDMDKDFFKASLAQVRTSLAETKYRLSLTCRNLFL